MCAYYTIQHSFPHDVPIQVGAHIIQVIVIKFYGTLCHKNSPCLTSSNFVKSQPILPKFFQRWKHDKKYYATSTISMSLKLTVTRADINRHETERILQSRVRP